MIRLSNIHSVTDFQRNPKGLLGILKESGSPVVLTVNGKAEFVVQDAASYQALVDKVHAAAEMEKAREEAARAQAALGRPVAAFSTEMERARGFAGRHSAVEGSAAADDD